MKHKERKNYNSIKDLTEKDKEDINVIKKEKLYESRLNRKLMKLLKDNNIEYDARTAAEELAAATRSEVVQVIGSKFVLYRETHSKPKEKRIQLVKPSSGVSSRMARNAFFMNVNCSASNGSSVPIRE